MAMAAGMWLVWQWSEAQNEARHTRALEQIVKAEREGIQRAKQIDRKHRAEINRLRADVALLRRNTDAAGGLRDRNASGTGHTISADGAPAQWRLSDESGAFLRAEAERADELKAWADACWAWVQQK